VWCVDEVMVVCFWKAEGFKREREKKSSVASLFLVWAFRPSANLFTTSALSVFFRSMATVTSCRYTKPRQPSRANPKPTPRPWKIPWSGTVSVDETSYNVQRTVYSLLQSCICNDSTVSLDTHEYRG
jgi:hypothetical protein